MNVDVTFLSDSGSVFVDDFRQRFISIFIKVENVMNLE